MIESYGEALRRLRKARGLSQRTLVDDERVRADHSRISKIETGAELGSPELAEELDVVLDAGGVLIAAHTRDSEARREAGDPMRRRTMLQALTALSLGAAGSAEAREALRHGFGLALGIDRTADEWAEVALDYAKDFFTTPAAQIVNDVTSDMVVLEQMIDTETRQSAKRELSSVGAQLSVIMAMGLASLGQTRQARRWWSTARGAADFADDAPIRMWARDWEAVNGLYERRPTRSVIALADEGLAISSVVCAGRAGLLAASAQARSTLGDADGAVSALRELETLTRAMPSDVQADIDSMHGWPDVRLHHTKSYVHTHLGDTTEAYAAQDAAFALYPPELARERAQVQMHRATCMVIDGEVTSGIDYAHQALDDLPLELHNALLFQVARKVVDAVPPSGRERPDVLELAHRMSPASLPALGA
jgi:transcriptional regulator with XRE-family HTH domain